jgi:hypothetical protein
MTTIRQGNYLSKYNNMMYILYAQIYIYIYHNIVTLKTCIAANIKIKDMYI